MSDAVIEHLKKQLAEARAENEELKRNIDVKFKLKYKTEIETVRRVNKSFADKNSQLKAENEALKGDLEDANGESAYTRDLNLALLNELGDYKRIIPDLLKHDKYKLIIKSLREWLLIDTNPDESESLDFRKGRGKHLNMIKIDKQEYLKLK